MFNEEYYNNIWGTVHRHDYCEDLADWLISKYGKPRILDVGTGCGMLVKRLRERGCDAWGLEISDYAVANSCCRDHVRLGTVLDIPFASDRFDVVYSQGLWEYIKEEDIKRAWDECKRVGKYQEHNYDTSEEDNFPEHQKITVKSREWWMDRFYPKILVACPNHEMKEYCFQRWIDNVKSFTYPNFDIFVVDNSPTTDFYERWKDKLPMIHIELPPKVINGPEARINYSMEEIRQKFLKGNYFRWFNVESDIIPPPDIIESMLPLAKETDWLAHGYPDRNSDPDVEVMQGVGCCMFSPELVRDFNFHVAGDNYTADGWLWDKVRPLNKFVTIEMWGKFKVKHLKE